MLQSSISLFMEYKALKGASEGVLVFFPSDCVMVRGKSSLASLNPPFVL